MQLLRHKPTGELYVYTTYLAARPDMELVVETPFEKVAAEVGLSPKPPKGRTSSKAITIPEVE